LLIHINIIKKDLLLFILTATDSVVRKY
jgi:hypothetical protein